ncbi:MAG: sucrase ferredoxin [Myxococcota bacterium]
MNGLRCSAESTKIGEPLAGTAPEAVRTWLLLEVNDPWAPKAIQTDALPADVRTRIEAWLDAHPGSRLQLIRRPQRPARAQALMIVDSERNRVARAAIDGYDALRTVDLDALAAGASAAESPLYLVCVHGRRDRCCAEHGSAVFRAMARRDVEVWQTSHLGGHRFAACAVWLPGGWMYGRLRKDDVEALVTAHRAGELGSLSRFRGRALYDRPTQAAETFLRERLGDNRVDAFRWRSTEPEGESIWRVGFVRAGAPHAIKVARQLLDAPRPASCGAEPEPATRFVEVA